MKLSLCATTGAHGSPPAHAPAVEGGHDAPPAPESGLRIRANSPVDLATFRPTARNTATGAPAEVLAEVERRRVAERARPEASWWAVIDAKCDVVSGPFSDPIAAMRAMRRQPGTNLLVVDDLGRHVSSKVPAERWDWPAIQKVALAWREMRRPA